MKERRPVYICYDSDVITKPRVQAAEQRLAAALDAHSCGVSVVRLPLARDGDKKQGADDFLKAHGKAAFAKLVRVAQPVATNTGKGGEPVLQKFADIEVEEAEWLWQNRIVCGMLNAIIGDPGEGKSTLAMEIAARGSRGEQPWTKAKCKPFSTLYMSNENTHSITSKPRFLAMNGDEQCMFALDKVAQPDGTMRPVKLDDVEVIEKAIKQTKARLVIIDPLQSYLGGKVDSNQANQTREKLDPLVDLAKRTGAAFLIVAHTAKAEKSRAIHSMLGSVDIAGAMRSILMLGTPAENRQERALLLVKHSVGPWDETLGFRIVKVEGKGSRTRIEWRGPVAYTFEDLRAPEKKINTQRHRASDWLRTALSEKPRAAAELVAEWAAYSGLEPGPKGRAERTLQEAAGLVGVERNYQGGKHGKRMWKLKPHKFAAANGP